MKKVLALVLALVMLFAVCVPAFAADKKTITQSGPTGPSSDTATVITDGTAVNETFTVTYPANVEITFNSPDAVNFTYHVFCQLRSDRELKVTVAKAYDDVNATYDMVGQNDPSARLAYTLSGDGVDTAFLTGASSYDADQNLSVQVPTWGAIDRYEGHITYTAEAVAM